MRKPLGFFGSQPIINATFKPFPTESQLRKSRRRKPIKLYSLVLVWWHDAAMSPGWHDGLEVKDSATLGLAMSSGFLVYRDRARIVLGMGISAHGDVSHAFAIPRSQIVKLEVAREPGTLQEG